MAQQLDGVVLMQLAFSVLAGSLQMPTLARQHASGSGMLASIQALLVKCLTCACICIAAQVNLSCACDLKSATLQTVR
jgi:hypothetical protein